jgi:hypothetical protein
VSGATGLFLAIEQDLAIILRLELNLKISRCIRGTRNRSEKSDSSCPGYNTGDAPAKFLESSHSRPINGLWRFSNDDRQNLLVPPSKFSPIPLLPAPLFSLFETACQCFPYYGVVGVDVAGATRIW